MRSYERLADQLAAAGVTRVFGVLGDGNMHWAAAYRERPGCAWLPAWHESGAVWMADGHAAATGGVGVASVTMGPGLAQALSAVTTAARRRRPVVVITAALKPATPPQAQEAPQRAWVEASGARYRQVSAPGDLGAGLADALGSARDGVPCVLAVDLDVFLEEAESPDIVEETAAKQPGPDLAEASRLLDAARRPVLLIGAGVLTSGTLPAALELARRIGAPVATTLGGRAHLPAEPFDLGVAGMMAHDVARDVLAGADLTVVLGAALDRYNTDSGSLGAGGRLLRVDLRPGWRPGVETVDVAGELRTVLPALVTRAGTPRPGARTPELAGRLAAEATRRRALAEQAIDDGPNPWQVVAVLDELLPSDAHIVVGIGHFWYFVAPYLSPRSARTFHFTSGFGLIGQALPTAAGAALGTGRPVVAIEGDGSVAMNVQELHAAVRAGADLLLVVLDNQAYGSEYHKLVLAGLDVASSEGSFPIGAAAAAFGAVTREAAGPAQLAAALTELLPLPGVRVITAAISRRTMSEVYHRQHVPSH